jgi:hypothetical protein
VCGFDAEDCAVLSDGLIKFGIKSVTFTDPRGYSRMRLNADDAERFFLLVAPYVPPAMQYKLPVRYRGHAGWLPDATSEYKPTLVSQQITAIRRLSKNVVESNRYDIVTTTGNFIAQGVVVHSSNHLGLGLSPLAVSRDAPPARGAPNNGLSYKHSQGASTKVMDIELVERRVSRSSMQGV